MTQAKPTVLLTGASGVIGQALIDELVEDHTLICLFHRTPVDDPRVETIQGDATRENLGLTAADYAKICDRVDVVINSAANTNWRAKPEVIRATNLDSTANLLTATRDAGGIFYQVSTAFVHRHEDEGNSPTHSNVSGVNAYVSSKVASEELVRSSGLPAIIVRPSVVIGDSRSGRISSFQGIYKVIGSTYKGTLPVLPANAHSMIDCVPQDVVTSAMARLLRSGATSGEYWLTAGEHALSLDDMVRLTLDLAELVGERPHPPRMVPVESVDRLLIPMLEDVLPPSLRRQFDAFVELMLLFQADSAMPSSLAEIGVEISHPGLCDAFSRASQWYVDQRLAPAATAAVS